MTILNNRDVSAVVALRLENSAQKARDRFDGAGDYDRMCNAKLEGHLKFMTDSREQIMDHEAHNTRYLRDIERGGLKPTEDSQRTFENNKKKIARLKKDRRRAQNEKLPRGGLQERFELWYARHGEPLQEDIRDPKPIKGKSNSEMLAITIEGIGELEAMFSEVDAAPPPREDVRNRIKSTVARLAAPAKPFVRPAAKMLPVGNTGRRAQGDVGFHRVRVGDGMRDILDPAIIFAVFQTQVEQYLLAEADKLDYSNALSDAEREADKAELKQKIDEAQRDAAEWWWRCRAEGLTDLEPPNVPVPALLGVVRAEGVPPVADDNDQHDPNRHRIHWGDADGADGEPDFG